MKWKLSPRPIMNIKNFINYHIFLPQWILLYFDSYENERVNWACCFICELTMTLIECHRNECVLLGFDLTYLSKIIERAVVIKYKASSEAYCKSELNITVTQIIYNF